MISNTRRKNHRVSYSLQAYNTSFTMENQHHSFAQFLNFLWQCKYIPFLSGEALCRWFSPVEKKKIPQKAIPVKYGKNPGKTGNWCLQFQNVVLEWYSVEDGDFPESHWLFCTETAFSGSEFLSVFCASDISQPLVGMGQWPIRWRWMRYRYVSSNNVTAQSRSVGGGVGDPTLQSGPDFVHPFS